MPDDVKENFKHEPGNAFNFKVGKLMEKHKVAAGVMIFHPGGEVFNGVEVLYIGDPSIDWICVAFENLCKEILAREDKGLLLTATPPVPEEIKELTNG